MLGEDDLDDLAWEAPFLARVTGAVLSGDYPVYTIAEQDADPETGLPQDAAPGRAGPARERNNQVVKVGTYVQAQFRTVFDGEPLYEFDCGCPCDCCCPVTEGFEVPAFTLLYSDAAAEWAGLSMGGLTGTIDVTAGVPSVGGPKQPLDADLTAIAALATTSFGRDFLTLAGAAAARAYTGAGDALTSGTLAQFAATTSAQLRGVLSDETGTGLAYFQGGDLGTPSAGVLTNATGLPTAGLVNDAVTYAKLQNASSSSRVLARQTAGAGDWEEVTPSGVLDMVTGTNGDMLRRAAGTWTQLAIGSTGNALLVASGLPAWGWASGKVLGVSRVATQESTTSATPVDLTTTQHLTVNVDADCDVLIWCFASYINTTNTQLGAIYADIDGTDFLVAQGGNYSTTLATPLAGVYKASLTLAGNPHTLKLQFSRPTGGTNFYSDRAIVVTKV